MSVLAPPWTWVLWLQRRYGVCCTLCLRMLSIGLQLSCSEEAHLAYDRRHQSHSWPQFLSDRESNGSKGPSHIPLYPLSPVNWSHSIRGKLGMASPGHRFVGKITAWGGFMSPMFTAGCFAQCQSITRVLEEKKEQQLLSWVSGSHVWSPPRFKVSGTYGT